MSLASYPECGFPLIADGVANGDHDGKPEATKGQAGQMMNKFPRYARRLA